jgi:hypothetical protein
MKTMLIGCAGVVGISVIAVIIIAAYVIGLNNQAVILATTMEQKQRDNKSEYDNMWKKISQVAQVTDAQKNALKDIFTSYAEARNNGSDNQIMTWINESVPTVDTTTFNNLQNIIVGSRDAFTFRQKELLDLKRAHDTLLRTFPSNLILKFLGHKEIDVTIVTSSKTEKSFETGKDDDVDVFKK